MMADQRGPYAPALGPPSTQSYNMTAEDRHYAGQEYQVSDRGAVVPSQPSMARANYSRGPPPTAPLPQRMQSQQKHSRYNTGYNQGTIQGLQRSMRSMTMGDPAQVGSEEYDEAAGYGHRHPANQPQYNGREYTDVHHSQWAGPEGPQQNQHPLEEPYQHEWDSPSWRDSQAYSHGQTQHTYYEEQPVTFQPAQRSMTMPSSVQYQPYNTRRAPAPTKKEQSFHGYGAQMDSGPHFSRESVRESVGDLLDAYYEDPEPLNDTNGRTSARTDQTAAVNVSLNAGGTTGGYHSSVTYVPSAAYQRPNFSRPQPHTLGLPSSIPMVDNRHNQTPDFSQLALRSRSHPNLHSGSDQNPYPSAYESHHLGHSEGQPLSYIGAPAPSSSTKVIPQYPRRVDSASQRPGPRIESPITPSVSGDLQPAHPELGAMRELEGALPYGGPHNQAQSHPPPPIRPGLVMDMNHPPPQRQYDVEKTRDSSVVESGPVTHQELEQLSSAVKMNPGDPKLHLTYAKKLVEAATVLASDGGRADVKTTRKNRENYIYEAHKIIKKLTNSSNPYPDAIFYLASCYGEGLLGLQIDHEKAYNLYQSAAKLGHGPSAYRTAVCSELGAGIRRDPLKAITWYKKAASIGETPAMFKLGMIQWKGLLGQPRNPRDGLIWLKRAADKADENNQHALHELALIYERPEGSDVVIPDVAYARELFMKAADLGYPASQFRLGAAYEYGTMGCPVDPKKSIAWYSKAAMKGDLESQLALSGWYLTGSEGVLQQSDTEAYLWARKAAEKGLAKAEYALGYFTEVGIGVPGNLEEAKRWYYKAASQGHPKAQARLQELKKGGVAGTQKSRERLSRSNVKHGEQGDCVIM